MIQRKESGDRSIKSLGVHYSALVADSCFLCRVGAEHVLQGAPAAGEGFGTCDECSVHACPRHGDKDRQYFRCAECFAAEGAGLALTEPDPSRAAELRGRAPRLSALSAEMRQQFDAARMGAAIDWVHRRAREGEALLPGVAEGIDLGGKREAVSALGFSEEDVDPSAALEELGLRTIVIEDWVRDRAGQSGPDQEGQRFTAGELAAAAVAIAYMARGVESAESSPFQIRGGLLLPPSVVVFGHAYSVANHFFW